MKILNTWLVRDGGYWTFLYEVEQQGTSDTLMCYIAKHQFSGDDVGLRFIGFERAHIMIEEANDRAK